ncbi:MAG: hypothetical protein ACOX9C_04460 [Kiritimatiellia bacterium]|jgi:hypothetical protein
MKLPPPPTPGYPLTANWGRAVVDAIRRLRPQAGPGIRLNQTPEGTTYSAVREPPPPAADPTPPMPFDVRVKAIQSGQARLEIYIVNKGELVTRNGHAVPGDGGLGGNGWVPLATVSAAGTTFVHLTIDLNAGHEAAWYAGESGLQWSIATSSSSPSLDEIQRRQRTPVLIAVVVDGVVNQIAHGAIATFYDSPDSERPTMTTASAAHAEEDGALQLYGFDDTTGKKTIYDLKGAALRDFILRFGEADDTTRVRYADGETVADYVLPQNTEIKWTVEFDSISGYIVQYRALWDVATRTWVKDVETEPTLIAQIAEPAWGEVMPDGTWIWGRVVYDSAYKKFKQYKMVWDETARIFVESDEAFDIVTLESHASQHTGQ